ncbi:MAG: sulfate adenylyltransferase small subunit, partial [Vicinamibacterales bacterium]
YIEAQRIPLPELYFSHERQVFERDGLLVAMSPFVQPQASEMVTQRRVRFRTLGDAVCSGAVESTANTVAEVIAETVASRITERGGRLDDRRSDTAMEDRKRDGYF